MDGNKRNFFNKRPNIQFKKKGNNRKGKWNNSSREQSLGNSESVDTVYRILCPSKKIGGVIGKGGSIVRALREETQAKITVADSVAGADERVIIIYSSPNKLSRNQNDEEDSAGENELEPMEPHCAAQDALLKVHDRIIEEDLFGGMTFEDDNENNVVTTRLLVPNFMVGCLLGKRGDVIQRLRSETGANIRVLSADHLPTCAMSTDELVQISGKRDVAKKALYDVSTLLHQNPRKDKPPLTFPMPFGGQGFHPPGAPLPNMLPPGNPMWSHWNSDSHGMPPMPWMGGYGNRPSEFVPGGFNGVPPGPVAEASAEFFMKILCSAGKIGGVIGKGGFNVRQLQQETGAGIYVQEASTDSDERVIRVSAFEAIWNQRSQTIEAILQLQNKVSEYSEKGNIITRLLVPSSKVGCILGQGGHVINEMRKRTQADIRVFSKDDKPKCAAEDEELVQVSGNFGVAKDALAEIASRLRVRTLRDANAAAESAPVGPSQGLRPAGSIPGGGLPQSGTMGAGSSGRYDPLKVEGYEYEPQSYPVPRAATGYPNVNSASDVKIPSSAVSSVIGSGGSNISNVGEVVGARVKLQNSHAGGSGCAVDIRGSSEHLNAAQSILQAFMASGGQNVNSQNYQNMNAQQGSYQNMNAQQSYQGSYQNMNAQQSPYQSSGQQGSYPNINVPQGAYHNISAQQSYQY
ncbi:KH domain-containing protein At4g18375-like isoform X1 [Quercus robur]|uniref:KH domain-containing protein At4g18375-like isoform X1 n=1 Tax=Quercus robur TaxID=38942 RepID=UPI0021625A65|nr:KH domain-containing protein At4g18375-like isoform X1 [Quercus robur]